MQTNKKTIKLYYKWIFMAEIKEEKLYVILSEMLSAIEEDPDMVETELRNTYIIEIVRALGWPEDNITSEKGVKLATTNHRVDYELSYRGKSKVAIEIKRPKESLDKGAREQLSDYLLKLDSDVGLAFNGQELTILNQKGKHLATWNFNRSNSIPKNVKELIEIFRKYVAYSSVIKKDFDVSKASNAHDRLLEEPEGQKLPESINIDNGDYTNKKSPILFSQWIGIFGVLILILIFIIYLFANVNTNNAPNTIPQYYSSIPTSIPPITRHVLLNFSGNTVGGVFCLIPDTPYVYEEYQLAKGENVTWVINQSVYSTTMIIFDNQSKFDSFVNMVQNASEIYAKYKSTCTYYNYTTAFCENYSSQNPGLEPYISLESEVQSINPVMESLPQAYINNITFTAPITGNYFFIVLDSRLSTINFASSSICYTDSYIYNTT